MKAKKLVSLALPVMLLSGCITIETDGKKANEPKKEETQQVEKENKASEKRVSQLIARKRIAYL